MSRASRQLRPIALAWMGELADGLTSWLADEIRSALDREVVVAGRIALPPEAYSPRRQQWHASTLLELLAGTNRPEWLRLLGIVDVDLYALGLNFVFGEADAGRRVAVFSTARLHAENPHAFRRRVATEAIHELGHTFGLQHCPRPSCVMWFSNTLEETDRKGVQPCAAHARALAHALQTGG